MQKAVIRNWTISFFLGASFVSADHITLANGEVIEGEIISQTPTEYTIKVTFAGGIRDLKTFKKEEIKDIQEEQKDLKPYQALQHILPTPGGLTATKYDQIINAQVKPFLSQFPQSEYHAAVTNILEELEKEKAQVEAGDVKINGEWIAAKARNADAIGFDSKIALSKMNDLAQSGKYRAAMILHDQIQKQYYRSDAAREASETAKKVLTSYKKIVTKMLERSKDAKAAYEKNLKDITSRDAQRISKAFDQKLAQHHKAVEQAKAQRQKWIPTNEFDAKNLKKLLSHIQSTSKRLERPFRSSSRDVAEIYRQTWAYATAGDPERAKRGVTRLQSYKVDEKYINLLNAQIEANPEKEPEEEIEEEPEETAPEIKEVIIPEEKPKEEEEEIKKPTPQKKNIEEFEEEKSSFSPIIFALLGLALIGILITVLLKKKKKE